MRVATSVSRSVSNLKSFRGIQTRPAGNSKDAKVHVFRFAALAKSGLVIFLTRPRSIAPGLVQFQD